jgi:oligopeptide/dipeptide ABC transporter ATP-binding protein
MGVIAGRTDRVVVMYAGKKAESAQTFDLFSQMRHPYTQALLNAVPKIEDAHYRLLSIPGLPPDLSTELTGCRFAERCSYVTSRCREVDPPIEIAKDSQSHEFACFNPILGARVSTEARVVSNQVDLRQAPVLIELQNVVKLFSVRSNGLFRRRTGQVHAISDISLVIRQGETFGLVGESGCGKTTTGKVMVGLEKPTSGTLTFQGEDLSGLRGDKRRYARRNIQMMFQDPYSSLNPRQRVGSILEEPLEIQRDGSSKERHARVLELLNQVGLSPSALIRYPHEFSGGQRQRIGLARALALKPRLLVADEPVSALDVSIQAQILNLIKDLQSDLGLSLLMISHDLGVVRYMADTVGVMYLGKLVEVGPSDEIYRNPCHPYTRGLLDSVPKPFATEAPEDVEIKIQGELPSSVFPPSGCRFRTRCPRAQEICANEEPPFRPFGTDHTAACHFPLRTPVMVEISSQVAPPR